LITDEVLAVGDESFQKKCIVWMEKYLNNGGTLLLCSHSMYHIQKLCKQAVWIDQGRIREKGLSANVARNYLAWHEEKGRPSKVVNVSSKTASQDTEGIYHVESMNLNGIDKQQVISLNPQSDLTVSGTVYSPDGRTPHIAVGIVPFVSLGITEQTARDGYGQWMSFAVDASLTTSAIALVPPNAPCQVGDNDLLCSADDITNAKRKKGFCQAGLPQNTRINVDLGNGRTQQAAFLILSHGLNKFGAFKNEPRDNNDRYPFASSRVLCSANAGAERCNADSDINFVYSKGIAGSNDAYDDQMIYFDRNALIAYSGNSPCQTVW
jgi:hypothetical protein